MVSPRVRYSRGRTNFTNLIRGARNCQYTAAGSSPWPDVSPACCGACCGHKITRRATAFGETQKRPFSEPSHVQRFGVAAKSCIVVGLSIVCPFTDGFKQYPTRTRSPPSKDAGCALRCERVGVDNAHILSRVLSHSNHFVRVKEVCTRHDEFEEAL